MREAGYDGRTLLIQYAYRMLDVDTPLGLYREEFAGYPEDQREGYSGGGHQPPSMS